MLKVILFSIGIINVIHYILFRVANSFPNNVLKSAFLHRRIPAKGVCKFGAEKEAESNSASRCLLLLFGLLKTDPPLPSGQEGMPLPGADRAAAALAKCSASSMDFLPSAPQARAALKQSPLPPYPPPSLHKLVRGASLGSHPDDSAPPKVTNILHAPPMQVSAA